MLRIFPFTGEEVWIQALYYGEPCKEYVSTFGRVRKSETGKIMNFDRDKSEYPGLTIHSAKDGSRLGQVYLHRLIAMTFFPDEVVREWHVHHKNHKPRDNRPSNLQWLSSSEHGKESARELPFNILTDEQVDQICRYLVIDKKSPAWIGKRMGIVSETIYNIIRLRYYTNQSKPYWEELRKLVWGHRDRSKYINKIDICVARGDSRSDIVNWLVENYGLDRQDAEYIHDRRRAIVLGDAKGEMKNDRRYKYIELVPVVEGMMAIGGEHPLVKAWLMAQGLTPDQAKDLIRQRVKAILEDRAHISLKGLEKGLRRMRKEYAKRLEKAAKSKATKDAKKAAKAYKHEAAALRIFIDMYKLLIG